MVDENTLTIYTDGSSFSTPRRGGIGVRFVQIDDDGHEQFQDVQFTGFRGATNNEMELMAVIQGMKEAMRLNLDSGFSKVVIVTDSLYVAENFNNAKFTWPGNKWRRKGGAPVQNVALWKDLVKQVVKIGKRVDINWVKGHSKDEHNKAVDKLAKASANVAFKSPLSITHVRKKHSSLSTELGSVGLHGQRLSIRIITAKYLPKHKLWKYKYEVISKGSKYKDCVDEIFSEILFSAGHCYYVVVNDDANNPTIKRLIRELER